MPVSDKKKASNANWDKKNMKRLSVAMRADEYEKMQDHTRTTQENTNAFIRRAIAETIAREQKREDA